MLFYSFALPGSKTDIPLWKKDIKKNKNKNKKKRWDTRSRFKKWGPVTSVEILAKW